MSLEKGAIAKPRPILGIRDLAREDLAMLKESRSTVTTTVDRFKDPHHRLARMFASGLRLKEVFDRSGYSMNRIVSLYADPAFQELIAHYRKLVDEAWVETVEEAHSLVVSNTVRAEKHIARRLDEAEEAGESIPIKDAIAISRDGMDRIGLGKKSVVTNINVDFAAQLERAIKRSGKQIDVTPNESPPRASPPQPAFTQQMAPAQAGSHPIASGEADALPPSRIRAPNVSTLHSHPSLEPVRRRA